MRVNKTEVFGLLKTHVDAHTMGIHAAASLLRECGYYVVIASAPVERAIEKIDAELNQDIVLNWIKVNHISRLGFSYRLDPDTAVELLGRLIHVLTVNGYYRGESSQIQSVFFAGLVLACEKIEQEYNGMIKTFRGGETVEESLLTMGIPYEEIPQQIMKDCKYDRFIYEFGVNVIHEGKYLAYKAPESMWYHEFGTFKDSLEQRLIAKKQYDGCPVIRAHLGPYSDKLSHKECIDEYKKWCYEIGQSGLLDVLSIGTSQLSQSNFGENWSGKLNGGGVPINSELEYIDVWKAARPMLVRTYSATKNIKKMAQMYERTINICWHAFSLWWFNELDGRGPNTLYYNLREHIDTIASVTRPVEANVSHHFAFRGADDITYIISGYLAAKVAKKCGVKFYVLQNMLNTPRSTWGIQDIAKGRTLLKLVKELETPKFKVVLQTRAGLDYFKPEIEKAKIQLAAVTALMDDIEPFNLQSPDIVHVVSYSEAICLATPSILHESIQITNTALQSYRSMKRRGLTPNVISAENIIMRQTKLEKSCRQIIKAMEENIPNLYTPEGLYLAFVAGWLPVPELWSDSDEFLYAKGWETKVSNGEVILCDGNFVVSTDSRINRCVAQMEEAKYMLKNKYKIGE